MSRTDQAQLPSTFSTFSTFSSSTCSPITFPPSAVQVYQSITHGLLVALVCYCLYKWAFPYLTQRFQPAICAAVPAHDQSELHVRGVSTLFACTIVPLALWSSVAMWRLEEAAVTASVPVVVQCTTKLAFGYFVWDLAISWKQHMDDHRPAFVVHALFCVTTYYVVGVQEHMITFGLSALLYELSTPFMNFRWLLHHLHMRRTPLWNRTNELFAITFVGVRILYGSFLTYTVLCDSLVNGCLPVHVRVLAVCNISASFALNCFWTITIIRNAIEYLSLTID